jgi:hypothetical protein
LLPGRRRPADNSCRAARRLMLGLATKLAGSRQQSGRVLIKRSSATLGLMSA